MPIVPEKQFLNQQIQGVVDCHFWNQAASSARDLTGTAPTLPCEPQPLSLCAPSGVSRVQFLTATKAVGVPFFPSYCLEHGGLARAAAHRRRPQLLRHLLRRRSPLPGRPHAHGVPSTLME